MTMGPDAHSRRGFLALLGGATCGAFVPWPGWGVLASQACADLKPEWLNSRMGISDAVLPPWTPLRVTRASGRVTVHCALRSYEFDGASVCHQITAASRPLLSAPVRLSAQAGGVPVAWTGTAPRVQTRTPARVVLEQRFTGHGLNVRVTTTLEYDGVVTCSCVVSARTAVTLDSLALDISTHDAHARFMHFYPEYMWPGARNSSAVPDIFAGPFIPYVWLGDDERGLAWFAESSQGWVPPGSGNVISLARAPGAVRMTVSLIGAPTRIGDAAESRTFAFGLQATPVKPITSTVWDERISHISQAAFGNVRFDVPDDALDRLAAAGVRTVVFHEHWTDTHNHYTTEYGAELKAFVGRCHARKLRVLLYFGFTISERAPEWPCYGMQSILGQKPDGWTPYNVPPQPPQNIYRVCFNSPWQDFLAFGVDHVMREYDVDGVYLDGTQYVWDCTNTRHGDGYPGADGKIVATYPMAATRNLMRRIYTIVKAHKPDGQVNVHSSGCNVTPTVGWATSYFSGEQLSRHWAQGRFEDALSLDMFRAEFSGSNIGVPAEFLAGGFEFSDALAFTLLHDVPVRPIGVNATLALMERLWKVRNDFGVREAQWLPYFRNSTFVSTGAIGGYVSMHKHRANGVLAWISNLTRTAQDMAVTFAFDQLQLGGPVTATDVMSGAALEMRGNVLTVRTAALGWRVVRLKSG